ncbi:hypothetical protein FO519_001218 [Halicephalobus sp. NKZ332]|nr:hypothetical protein FO519_001218 [Halicephalobus sp. NKZ332]
MTLQDVADVINGITFRLFGITGYLNIALLASFFIVVSYDLKRKSTSTRTSFFIISFSNVTFNLVWTITQILGFYIFVPWISMIFDIIWIAAFMFDGWILVVLAVNRFTALVYPVSYRRVWSNENTIIVVSAVFVTVSLISLLLHFYPMDEKSRVLFNAVISLLNLASSLIGLILSIICVLKADPSIQKAKLKAERRLLLTSFILAACHVVADIDSAFRYISTYNKNIVFTFGYFGDAIFHLTISFSAFWLIGGMVILLFINSQAVRKAFWRFPLIAFFLDPNSRPWNKTNRVASVTMVSNFVTIIKPAKKSQLRSHGSRK